MPVPFGEFGDPSLVQCPEAKVKTILPIEPFKQYVEARWYAEKRVPRDLAKRVCGECTAHGGIFLC